jgi:hypothetical protein
MKQCRECGKPTRRGATFCSGPICRTEWHKRRRARGAELYDILMAWRFERESGNDDMALLARLASAYRQSDVNLRKGRKSWDRDEAVARLPLAYSPSAGDGR